MADLIAYKMFKNVEKKQRFSQHSWDLLGKDKNGWYLKDEQTVDNTVKIQKKSVSGPAKEQVIDNSIVKDTGSIIDNGIGKGTKKDEPGDDESKKFEEFLKHVDGFNKSTIKNYFDGLTPPVVYDNKSNLHTLKMQLGESLKFDIVELQKAFTL